MDDRDYRSSRRSSSNSGSRTGRDGRYSGEPPYRSGSRSTGTYREDSSYSDSRSRRSSSYSDGGSRRSSGSYSTSRSSAGRSNSSSAKRRNTNRRRKKRGSKLKVFFLLLGVMLMLCLAGVLGGMKLFEMKTGQTLASCIKEGKLIAASSSEKDFAGGTVSYVYSSDQKKIAELSLEKESVRLTYDQIPENVVNAFVAVEDQSFWTNDGTDPKGIARVLFNYVKTLGKKANGASTITQQLVKLTYLSSEKSLSRKVKEIVIARDITKNKYSKEQIIAFYCNACCFANGIYGINDAAEAYFGKTPEELTLSETAYLCAIPNWPEHYNPRTNPENALTRRDKILKDMLEQEYISDDEYEEAVNEKISIHEVNAEKEDNYNYETTYAINCAAKVIMERQDFEFRSTFTSDEDYKNYQNEYDEAMRAARHELYTGGYRIYTTIDLEAQDELQAVLDDALSGKDQKLESGIYQVQGAMTVIDNHTGKVIAIIGGRTQAETAGMYTINRAYQGYAQPGSSIKPLVVYAPAMDTGEYNTASVLFNIDVDTAKNQNYTVSEIREMTGKGVTLRYAVENSLNGCAYWLFSQIGVKTGLSYVQNMEFAKIVPGDYNMSACLGGLTYGVTTEEMANAYYTLENNGTFRDTDCLTSILDSNGIEIYEQPQEKNIYTVDAARRMTGAMKGVLTDGTADNSDWYDYTSTEAAGKTGTTNDNKAAWFCGYTPYYTIAVWVGCDTPTVVKGLNGNSYPLTIWQKSMLKLIKGKPAASFDEAIVDEEETEPERTCTCTVRCAEGFIDPHCEICNEDYDKCTAPEAECICEEKCEGDSLNEQCDVCMRNPDMCRGVEHVCNCPVRCTEDTVNDSCPVCSSDYMECTGEIQEPEPDPEPEPGDEPADEPGGGGSDEPADEPGGEEEMVDPPEEDDEAEMNGRSQE